MPLLHTLISQLETFAPPELAPFDFVGLLQGDGDQEIKKVGLTLDYSLLALQKAVEKQCDLLITHHGPTEIAYPLRGNFLSKISYASEHNLSVYRSHLSLDFCPGGIIDTLCSILKIPAKPMPTRYHQYDIFGGVYLAENYPLTFASLMDRARVLSPSYIRIAGKRRERFSRIAVTSGQGFMPEFFDQLKPEVYIAGEFEQEATKYAEDLGIMLVELSHHASEVKPLEKIAQKFTKLLGVSVEMIEIPDTIQVVQTKE